MSDGRATYTVRCRRVGGWWAVDVPQVDGAFGQARRLDQVENTAREIVALLLEVPPDSFGILVQPVLPEGLERAVGEARELRGRAARLAAQASAATKAVVDDLRTQLGLPLRDVGQLVGVSHQRVAQILREDSTTRSSD